MAKELDEQVDAEFRAQALYFQFSGGWQFPLSKMKRRIVARSGDERRGPASAVVDVGLGQDVTETTLCGSYRRGQHER